MKASFHPVNDHEDNVQYHPAVIIDSEKYICWDQSFNFAETAEAFSWGVIIVMTGKIIKLLDTSGFSYYTEPQAIDDHTDIGLSQS